LGINQGRGGTRPYRATARLEACRRYFTGTHPFPGMNSRLPGFDLQPIAATIVISNRINNTHLDMPEC